MHLGGKRRERERKKKLGHDSDPEARNTESFNSKNTHRYTFTVASYEYKPKCTLAHIHAACWLCLNELENWSLENHLSEQSEMRL